MDLRGVRPSRNFEDRTGQHSLIDQVGEYLLRNGIVNNAAGKPYQEPWRAPTPSRPGDWPTGASIQRFAGSNDDLARQHGFRDAQTMLAWKQRQNEMRGANGSGINADTARNALAWHPAMILQWVSDHYKQATGQ